MRAHLFGEGLGRGTVARLNSERALGVGDGLNQGLFTVGLAGHICHAFLLEQAAVSGTQGWWRQDPGEQRLI